MVPGLSPYGAHISGMEERWSCDCIDPFAGPYACFGSTEPCSCNYLPCSLLASMLHEDLSDMKSALSGSSSFTSTGKQCLIQDVNDEWLELEAELNHLIDDKPNNMTADTTVVDNIGYRDINAEAIKFELKLFSGVIRLNTMMDIFKIDSFSRRLDFFDCLRCCCTMAHDPIFGTMVVFKGHFYLPARKVKEIQQERNHLFGTKVEALSSTQQEYSKRKRRGKKRCRTRPNALVHPPISLFDTFKSSDQLERKASQHDLVPTNDNRMGDISSAENLSDEPQSLKESTTTISCPALLPTNDTSIHEESPKWLYSSEELATIDSPPAIIPATDSPPPAILPQISRIEMVPSSNAWAKVAAKPTIYSSEKNHFPSLGSKSTRLDSSRASGKTIDATSFPSRLPTSSVLINVHALPTPTPPPGFETMIPSSNWAKVASTSIAVPISRASRPTLPSKSPFPNQLQATYQGINFTRSDNVVPPQTGSIDRSRRWVMVAPRPTKIFQRFELSKLAREPLKSKVTVFGNTKNTEVAKDTERNKRSIWSPPMDRSRMLWRGKTMVL